MKLLQTETPTSDSQQTDIQAEDWLKYEEKILKALHIPDDGEKIRMVTYTFTSDVDD